MSGHCVALLVTPTGQTVTSVRSYVQLLVYTTGKYLSLLVSSYCIGLLVASTGQLLQVLVSSHCVGLLVIG